MFLANFLIKEIILLLEIFLEITNNIYYIQILKYLIIMTYSVESKILVVTLAFYKLNFARGL